MEQWRKDARNEIIMVDIEALVPKDHLLRKIEKVMDYEWLYERLEPYYCHDNGRPGTDPVVLIKMVLIQHLFGIPSLRQTYQRIQDTLSYRWFLGYGLLDEIPHFATVSYAFCKRFPEELTQEIFEHILNKDFLEANSVLEKLISEAEEDRENAVSAEFGFESEKGGDETPNDGGEDVQLDASPEGMSDEDTTKAVDDAIEIECQINAKIVAKLFDKVSALKQDLDNANLDQDSREFIKFDTSITYYSDKLQDLQGKTNPGVDQAKVEEALNKIGTSLDQLKGEIGGGSSDDSIDVASPEQIASASEDEGEGDGNGNSNETPADNSNKEEKIKDETPAEDDGNAKESSAEGTEDDTDFDDLFA